MKRRSQVYFGMLAETVEVMVKKRIISAGNLTGTKPENLPPSANLSNDLLFGSQEFNSLCDLLISLVSQLKSGATIKCSDIQSAETVKDIIQLVNDAL